MIVALWGEEKSWKTTMSLTFPRPLFHMDLDVGGFERASWRISETDGISSKSYPTPIQIEKMMGTTKTESTIRFPKKILGIKEVWQQIVIDYVAAVNNAEVKTIVIDSSTQQGPMGSILYLHIILVMFMPSAQEIEVSRNIRLGRLRLTVSRILRSW